MTKIFSQGLIIKLPLPNAPEWVKAKLSFKVSEFVEFLQKHDSNGWVNVDMLLSQDGSKLYGALNDYKKAEGSERSAEVTEAKEETTETPPDEIIASEIPF